jgi:hypothetical protein
VKRYDMIGALWVLWSLSLLILLFMGMAIVFDYLGQQEVAPCQITSSK